MQPGNVLRHWLRLSLPKTLEEAALDTELCNAFIRLNYGGHFKQTVRFTNVALAGRIAASHHNALGSLLNNLKMVCDLSANFIRRGEQLVGSPELVRGVGTLVFPS